MKRYVAVLPCLPKEPDWSNQQLNSQQLGRGGIARLGGRENKQEEKSRPAKKRGGENEGKEEGDMRGQSGSCQPANTEQDIERKVKHPEAKR